MSSLCLAALPYKMSAFNGYMRQSAVLPQAFFQKSLDSQKNSLNLKKITRFKIFALNFAVLLELI